MGSAVLQHGGNLGWGCVQLCEVSCVVVSQVPVSGGQGWSQLWCLSTPPALHLPSTFPS